MKKIISILCIIAMSMCFVTPSGATDELTLYSMGDIRDGSISTALIGLDDAQSEEEDEFSVCSSTLPTSYDSRTTGCVPEIRNQGDTGACWAFATMSALEIDACKQGWETADTVDFSESHLVWFTYSADTNKKSALYGEQYVASNPYTVGGNWARATGTLARWSGVATESDYKFYGDKSDFSKMSNYDESGRYDTGSGVIIKEANVFTSASDVKNWIINHGSCTATINWNMNNYNEATNSYYTTVSTPNHMITIVGWNDNYSRSNFKKQPSSNGAWLVRNSYGDELGNDGYFWLSYRDGSAEDFTGFAAQKADTYDNNYTYNATGFSTASSCTSGSEIANIFTTTSKQSLEAVSLYTITKNTTVTVKIYTDFTGNDVTTGTCVNTKKVNFSNRGYHTVVFDEANELAGGTKYAVYACYTVSTGAVEFPVEKLNATSDGVKYTYTSGQSVGKINDSKEWKDSSEYSIGNFYLQAFTTNVDSESTEQPSLAIKNFDSYNGKTLEYRSTITIFPEYSDVTDIKWYVDGASYTVNSDSSVTIKQAKGNFSVYCTAKTSSGELLTSETETINVDTSFFSILIAFFKGFFGLLPDITQ